MSDRYYVPPAPTVSIDEARHSPAKRAERDRQLAVWCEIPEDEVEGFLAALARFDANTPAWEARLRAAAERTALEEALAYAEQRRAVLRAVEAWEARINAAEAVGFTA